MLEAEALLKDRPGGGWLFSTPQGAMIHGNNFLDHVWKPLLRAVGVPALWTHAPRHTFATRLIKAGAIVVYVQKQFRHSSIQLTVYTDCHWIQDSQRNTRLEVDQLMGQTSR